MDNENERLHILDQIDRGEITASEGMQRLQALGAAETQPAELPDSGETASNSPQAPDISASENPPELDQPPPAGTSGPEVLVGEPVTGASALPPGADKWKKWWTVPVWVGTAIAVLGSMLMYTVYLSRGMGFWFLCSTLPFAVGLLLMIIGVQSRSAKWLHLRIQQEPGASPQKIAISFPLPIRFSAWFFRTFGQFIPNLDGMAVDQIILALDQTTTPENPVYISVDEGERGSKVDIYIG